jgi:transcriptional regulator with XRE-family HTH domain
MSTVTLTRPPARAGCPGNRLNGKHGTAADYGRGCRCEDAREARRLRRKRLREGRAEARTVPILGPSRRLQALMAIGWSQQQLAAKLGWPVSRVQEVVTRRHTYVRIDTARQIAAVYERLRLLPGTSQYARDHAHYAGFLSALWWDNIDLDPDPVRLGDDKPDHLVDEIAVELACRGELEAHRLRPVDQRAAMRYLVTTRLTVQEISQRVHASQRTVERCKAQIRAEQRVEKFAAALAAHGQALRPGARDRDEQLLAGLAHLVAVWRMHADRGRETVNVEPAPVDNQTYALFDLPRQRTALNLQTGVAA